MSASLVAPAAAQEPKSIGRNGDWNAYTFEEAGKPVCYMASVPIKAEGKYDKRGQIFALVTNRPARKSKAVVSIVTGYAYAKDSEVLVKIGSQRFILFTADDRAWTPDTKTDQKLVKAMIRGSRMIVAGTSSRGTKTKDTYSLKGFTATRKMIDRSCKM